MIFYIVIGFLFLALFTTFYIWNKAKKKPTITNEKKNIGMEYTSLPLTAPRDDNLRYFKFRGEEWALKYTERSTFLVHNGKEIIIEHILPKKYDIKNPIPFEWNGELMLLQSYYPLIIYVCDIQTGECRNFLEKHKVLTPDIGDVKVVAPPIIATNPKTEQEDYLFLAKLCDKKSVNYFFFWLNSITMEPSLPSPVISDWMDYHIEDINIDEMVEVITDTEILKYPKLILQDIA